MMLKQVIALDEETGIPWVDRLFRLKRTSPQEEYEQAAICQDDVDMLQRNRYLDPECKVPDPPANCAAVSKAAAMHHNIPEDVHAREEYFPQPRKVKLPQPLLSCSLDMHTSRERPSSEVPAEIGTRRPSSCKGRHELCPRVRLLFTLLLALLRTQAC